MMELGNLLLLKHVGFNNIVIRIGRFAFYHYISSFIVKLDEKTTNREFMQRDSSA